jgi:phosphoribosylamine--glycine ligase
MRFLFISRRGASLSLAKRIAEEGNEVKFFVNNKYYDKVGNGLIDKVSHKAIENYDLVVFDEYGMGEYSDKVAVHRPVFGSSGFADVFNNNKDYRNKILNKIGLEITTDKLGIKLNIGGLFNGFDFVRPLHFYIKRTKFMENDLSIETDCMGCVLWFTSANKITRETILKMRNILVKSGYKGAVNFELAIHNDKFYIQNIILGFCYDSTYAMLEGTRQPLGEFINKVASGSLKRMKASPDWLVSVRVTIPPYPFPVNKSYISKVEGINSDNDKHIWLRDIMLNEKGEYYSTGADGFLLTITARGLSIYQAFKRAYRTIGNLRIENLQYRHDIGEKIEKDINLLKEWGWI